MLRETLWWGMSMQRESQETLKHGTVPSLISKDLKMLNTDIIQIERLSQ
jgi:hypothetical protein